MKGVLISSPELWKYRRRGKHPATPDRLERTIELLSAYGVLTNERVRVIAPTPATESHVARFHSIDYIRAVRALSEEASDGMRSLPINSYEYGFGNADNPVFPGMYEASMLRAGGALQAANLILRGEARTVFHLGGGQHHAAPARTAGFCIFNDAVLACMALADRGWRVAYIDIDAHHGDGVQRAFYDTDRVLTISLHESGESLYPRTGFTREIGAGDGVGFSVNMPFAAGTQDETYLEAFQILVPLLLDRYQPDVLVTEIGADGHYLDPLSHLQLSTRTFVEITSTLRGLDIPWLALGGGGYNPHATARVWTLMFAEMIRINLPDALPVEFRDRRGGEFLRDTEVPMRFGDARTVTKDYAEARLAELERTIPLLSPYGDSGDRARSRNA